MCRHTYSLKNPDYSTFLWTNVWRSITSPHMMQLDGLMTCNKLWETTNSPRCFDEAKSTYIGYLDT